MMPKRGQSNRRTKMGAARLRLSAFTLIEMLVAVGMLLVMMGLAGQVFKIALDGTGRLTQLSEIDRSIRMFEDQLGRELATLDPTRDILAIGANPSPAYWTE